MHDTANLSAVKYATVPLHVIQAQDTERARLDEVTRVRERARSSGWPGPYRVQVLNSMIAHNADGIRDRLLDLWRDLPNTHDRRGTAIARCRALVHGLPDDVRPGWYGDRLSAIGSYDVARVVDARGCVVHEERGS